MVNGEEGGSHGGLRRLRIDGLRCILRASLQTEARVLVFSGPNGAGKTTVLEAIYLATRGRSFRGRKAGSLTSLGSRGTRVESEIELSDGARCRMAFRREESGRHDPGGAVQAGGSCGDPRVQVKLVPENAQALMDGEPELRRRFLDWNVYQSNPRFGKVLTDFRRVLAQRNSALRSRRPRRVLDTWNRAYAEAGAQLDRHREDFVGALDRSLGHVKCGSGFLSEATICYYRGWESGMTLEEAIESRNSEELARGLTLVGPMRADFWIGRDDKRVSFSRGQTKELVTLVQIAAERVHNERGREPAIFLLDDLEGELDVLAVERLRERLAGTQSQIVVTRIAAMADKGPWSGLGLTDVFHVEQGVIHASS
jgi:DNA replication and repair protein RecF